MTVGTSLERKAKDSGKGRLEDIPPPERSSVQYPFKHSPRGLLSLLLVLEVAETGVAVAAAA